MTMVNHPNRSKHQQVKAEPGPRSVINIVENLVAERERLKALNAELLAALKRMIEAYREGVQDDREPMMVRQAITAVAKAEGR